MGDKKKTTMPMPKAPAPTQQQSPPATAPTSGSPSSAAMPDKSADGAGAPPVQDHSQVPVTAQDKPDRVTSPDAPRLSIDRSLVTVPFDPLDWAAIRQPYLLRGAPLGTRDIGAIEQHWHWTYRGLTRFGFTPDRAITITNAATALAVDLSLRRDFPTTEERFDQETERTLGPGKSLNKIIVPLNFPIEWAVGKVIGRKFKLEF